MGLGCGDRAERANASRFTRCPSNRVRPNYQDPYISLSKFSGFAICWRAAVSKTSHRTRASKDSLEFIDYARPSTRCG